MLEELKRPKKEMVKIQNRRGKQIAVVVEVAKNPAGLAFVMHGLGGFKEQDHIQVIADAFGERNFTVVRFDTTNSLGESDGRYEDATITSYYEDLEDVIAWAGTQVWYQEPFVLSGHSLGGICTALYAEKFPGKVRALAPVSPVVSGKLSVEAHQHSDAEEFVKWEQTGWKEEESRSQPGIVKRLPWSHIIDRLKYDLIPNVSKLTMPVLLIVGERDTTTPAEHVKLLFDALPGKKEFHVIKEAPHTFREPEDLQEIKDIFVEWIDSLPEPGSKN